MGNKVFIYLTVSALDKIITFNDDYPNLYSLIYNFAEVILDVDNKELNSLMLIDQDPDTLYQNECLYDSSGNIAAFFRAADNIPIALREYFEEIKNNPELMLDKPMSIFLVNISPAKALEIRTNLGILVYSDSEFSDDIIMLRPYSKGYSRNQECGTNIDEAWRNIVPEEYAFPPMNSIVISDNHLFDNTVKNQKTGKILNLGTENIKHLLSRILPSTIKTLFTITIIANFSNNQHKKISSRYLIILPKTQSII